MANFSQKHRRAFEQAGYCIVDDFLDSQAISHAIQEIESLDAGSRGARTKRGVTFARRNMMAFDFVRAMLADRAVRRMVNAFAPGAVAVRAILFDKVEEANWTVPWHQDRSIAVRERIESSEYGPWSVKAGVIHVQPPLAVLQQMITLRFHLDPCRVDNGPLRIIPATHHRILSPGEIDHQVANGRQEICSTGAGGLLMMHPLLLHASSSSQAGLHRRVMHVEFGPPHLPGGVQWAFIANNDKSRI